MQKTLALGALFSAAALAPAGAEEIRIAVGCPPVPACSDWLWAEDLAARLNAGGLEAKVYTGGALGKDPEIVDQLAQNLLQFGLTNFVMIKEVDPTVLGFLAPYMFDDMAHFFRATLDTESELMDGVKASMAAQGVRIAGLPGIGGTMGIFNAKHPVTGPADLSDLRLRAIDDSQIKLFEQWGAAGAVVDMPEFAGAVGQGVVDGYFNPPIVPVIFKHTDFLTHYTDLAAGTPFRSALMSADWYDGLDDAARALVDEAVAAAMEGNRAWTLEAAKAEPAMLKERGVTVTVLTPEALADFRARSEAVWPILMPEDKIAAFTALADATRE